MLVFQFLLNGNISILPARVKNFTRFSNLRLLVKKCRNSVKSYGISNAQPLASA